MWSTTGVLIGVAEVTVPFRRLPEEEHAKVMQEIYMMMTTTATDDQNEETHIGRKAVGVMDEYYAMQEVVLEEKTPEKFSLRHDQELILKFRLTDVMFVGVVEGHDSQVIFVTRSESYGRAAVVLQFKNAEEAGKVDEKINHKRRKRPSLHRNEDSTQEEPSVFSRLTSLLAPPNKPSPTIPTEENRQSSFYQNDSGSDDNCSEDTAFSEEPDDSSVKHEPLVPKASIGKRPDPQMVIEAEINYILETEHKYVLALTSLEADRSKLAKTAPTYIRKWLSQLFRQVKSLATTHENLLLTLSEAKYDISKFSEAFVIHNKQFSLYVFYIENIPTVDMIIDEHKSFFKERTPCLIENLRLPRLRLNHYVLMLESLQKKVEAKDKGYLQEAINLCKKYLKDADQALFFCSIRGCPFQVAQCGNLIHKSELTLAKSPDLPNRPYLVILLEKKLLIVLGKMDDLQFVRSFPLEEIILSENARGLFFSFLATNEGRLSRDQKYSFKARNIRVQQEWLAKLRGTIGAVKTTLERNSGRASFGRSARKIRKRLTISRSVLTNTKPEVANNSDSDSDASSSKQYWISRRKNKKYSSNREQKRLTIYTGGSVSDGEENTSIRHGMAPLTVWEFFQKLEAIYKLLRSEQNNGDATFDCISMEKSDAILMNAFERKYIDDLQRQLGTFLEEGIEQPPKQIQKDIRHIYELHVEKLLPKIEEDDDVEVGFLKTLIKYGENFASLYGEFLINRCTYHEEMMDSILRENYVTPIEHFTKYCVAVIRLRKENRVQKELLTTAATILHDTITNANNYLMAECINNVPFALSQCEPISLINRFKIKIDNRSLNECEVVLVKDQLYILEIKPPLYNYVCSVRLDSVSLGPVMDKFQFYLVDASSVNAKKIYAFRAAREDIVTSWRDEITLILNEQARTLRLAIKERFEKAPKFQVASEDLLAVNHIVDISKSPRIKKKSFTKETDLPLKTAPKETLV